jgi:hypothetical protein
MARRRITGELVPRFDPTITQKVRAALIEDGHSDLVVEGLTAGLSLMEQEIQRIGRDVLLLQASDRDRLTQTGVWTFIKAKLDAQVIDWGTWALRGAIGAGVAGVLAVLGMLGHLAWK